jgi:hypothetical protein
MKQAKGGGRSLSLVVAGWLAAAQSNDDNKPSK